MKQNFQVIRETIVKTPDSMLTINPGTSVEIACEDFRQLTTVKSAATRLNQRADFIEFEVSSPDNGATIVITRNINPSKQKHHD